MLDSETDHVLEIPNQPDATFSMTEIGDNSLGEFFSRPILIQSFSWVPNVPFSGTLFDPWYLFFTNPRVSNRLNNYNLARAKMHVKVMINGNAFYFGRLMLSYSPLVNNNDFLVTRPIVAEDNIQLSQRPHIFIDPTTSQGGEMVLPFVFPYNAVNLPNGEFTSLGQLYITQLAALQHIQSGTKDLTVNIFAWCEDVELSVPTSQNTSGLAPQSGSEQGMISTPAAAAANVAAKLGSVPLIAPYAMASQVALSTIAAVAKAFGYSRPLNASDIAPMVPTFGNFANTNATETLSRMTLDQKAEVCVDSRVVGLNGHDEMTIKSIATRESFLVSFPWVMTASPNTLLWNTRLLPVMTARPAAYPTEYHITALSHISLPFKQWRGSLKYRFQIVSSGLHRGRLRFVWEPRYPVTTPELNLAYNRVIDISAEKDFTIEIGWGSRSPWLKVNDLVGSELVYQTTALVGADDLHSNGILSVYVQNELASTSSVAGVSNTAIVNVFVSAGDDFELAVPWDDRIQYLSYFPPPTVAPIAPPEQLDVQSGMEMSTACCSVPFAPTTIINMGKSLSGTSDIYKVMIPDPVASIRQVMKRYNFHSAIIPDNNPGVVNISTEGRSVFPYYRGYDPNGVDTIAAAAKYNFCTMTLLNWFTPAYICRRGAIRWKLLNTGPNGDTASPHNYVSSGFSHTEFFYRVKLNVPATSTANAVRGAFGGVSPGNAGFQVQPSRANPLLQMEFPHYKPKRFYLAQMRDLNVAQTSDLRRHDFYYVNQFQEPTVTQNNNTILSYVAAGDDYDLSFYVGAPIVYIYFDPAPA